MTVLSLTPAVVEEMKMKKHNKLWMIQKQLYTNSQLHQCKMLPLRLNVSQCHNIGVIIVKKKERKKTTIILHAKLREDEAWFLHMKNIIQVFLFSLDR